MFLSVHLNHDANKVRMLESLDKSLRSALKTLHASGAVTIASNVPTKKLVKGIPVDRVVIAMDSNDCYGNNLNTFAVRLLGFSLRNVGIAVRSGYAWPSGFLQVATGMRFMASLSSSFFLSFLCLRRSIP